MHQHREIDLELIDIEEQARKHFVEAELRLLGENIKEHGLLMPLLVVARPPRFTLVAGERRLRGMRLVGLKKALARVLDALTAADTAVVQYIENDMRSDLKPYEKACALRDVQKAKGWNKKQIAEHLHMDASLPGKYLSLFESCIPEVQAAAEADRIGVAAWHQVSLLSPADQPGLLAMYLSGMPAAQIASVSREKRKQPKPDSPKVGRCKLPLPTGVQIVLSGDSLDLECVIESLQQGLEAARKAVKESLDVKTAQRVWADKAKAGA